MRLSQEDFGQITMTDLLPDCLLPLNNITKKIYERGRGGGGARRGGRRRKMRKKEEEEEEEK